MTNYDSDKSIRLQILAEFGGDTTKHYDSTYSVDLELLNIIQGGGIAGQVIDDQNASTGTTYSSSKLLELLADAGFDTSIAQELPASGDPHTLYFIPSSNTETQNSYDEYLYVGSTWEQVGSTAIDLSNYATLDDISTFITEDELSDYATLDDISTFITADDASAFVEIVELTQLEYNALSTSEKNNGKIYSITDATITESYTKLEADARFNPINSTTANSGNYKFPNWNANGQITGQASQAYQSTLTVNGSGKTLYATGSGNMPSIYAPTSAGTSGQYLVSSGSGAPTWQALEVASDYVIADADASAGTYSNDIAAFYNKTISENIVQGVQIKVVNEHVVNNASVYSDSYYLPSSSRIYSGNVELWLMTTEDGATWENIHYLITDSTVSRDVSTGSFGPAVNA